MRVIASDFLIDDYLLEVAEQIHNYDNSIDIYIHTSGGRKKVNGGIYGTQIIDTFDVGVADQYFFKSVFAKLDLQVDLNFSFVSNSQDADIAFYYDKEINLDDQQNILGVIIPIVVSNKYAYEVFLNIPRFKNDQDYLRYAFIHELGHAIGLEHPFNSSDGDVFEDETSFSESAYPEETVMAYREPLNGLWPQYFSENDINALQKSWGIETKYNLQEYVLNHKYKFDEIKDYQGFLHGSKTFSSANNYKYQGKSDLDLDGYEEFIFTNSNTFRWISIGVQKDFNNYGEGGNTRVIGIYSDPLVENGIIKKGSPYDSQSRFTNDLKIDNLIYRQSGDYDGDGFQEVYWKTNDGTAYLRALMHADGNIQYANYQSESQMKDYLASSGYAENINDII